MRATILFEGRPAVPAGVRDGEHLWLPIAELPALTGWEAKPEGICRGEVCVPASPALVRGGRVDLAAFARLRGQPVARDDEHGVFAVGEAPAARREALATLEAPDFTLPDLEGRAHSLSDYRGHKVFLVS